MGNLTIQPDKRRQISSEISRLKSLTSRAGRRDEAVAVELARLFAAFPAQGQSDGSARLRMEAYFEAIDDAPAWAVGDARQRIVKGEGITDPRFAPTPPQLAQMVREVLKPLRRDLADLQDIATAVGDHAPTDAERNRVVTGFDKLKAEIQAAALSNPVP